MRELWNEDCFNVDIPQKVDLFIADPPYGNIICEDYDLVEDMYQLLFDLLNWMSEFAYTGSSAYIFGGIGKYRDRPFLRFALDLEHKTKWRIHNWITWAKRRGYGTQRNYIFAREEFLFLVFNDDFPKYFNAPYRDKERSAEWKKTLSKEKYKPRSDKFRYSNVIFDINELFRQKYVYAEKPELLYKLLVTASCPYPGLVVDPMCGSGTTAVVCEKMGRDYICIEKDEETFLTAQKRLKENNFK